MFPELTLCTGKYNHNLKDMIQEKLMYFLKYLTRNYGYMSTLYYKMTFRIFIWIQNKSPLEIVENN